MRICAVCQSVLPPSALTCPADGGAPHEVAELPPGAELNGYRVIRKLGAGGMGKVYEAEHLSLGRRVALKVLLPRYARDREALKRFLAEARAANLIKHENIIKIYDISAAPSGDVYFVMELLSGEDLGILLQREGRLSEPEVIELGLSTAKALAAAHEGGVIHRDLKPSNIFYDRREGQPAEVKLLDFGLAKLTEEPDSAASAGGPLLGTPHYMAPEYIRGGAPTPATDQYSFGVVLFRAATGQRPFDGQDALTIFKRQVKEVAPWPRSLRPELSEELSEIIARALKRKPEERFPSMTALLLSLQRLHDARPVGRPPARRVARPAWIAGGLAGGLGLGLGAWWWQRPVEVPAVVVDPAQSAAQVLAAAPPRQQAALLDALGEGCGAWVGPLVVPRLAHDSLEVRRAAALALGRSEIPGGRTALREASGGGGKLSLEVAAARFWLGDEDGRRALTESLANPVRRVPAAVALARGGARDGADLLRRSLEDGLLAEESAREAAAALFSLGDEAGRSWLARDAEGGSWRSLALLATRDAASRERLAEGAREQLPAALALAPLGDERALPRLRRELAARGPEEAAAAFALAQFACQRPLPEPVLQELEVHLSTRGPEVQFGISAALLASREDAAKGPHE